MDVHRVAPIRGRPGTLDAQPRHVRHNCAAADIRSCLVAPVRRHYWTVALKTTVAAPLSRPQARMDNEATPREVTDTAR